MYEMQTGAILDHPQIWQDIGGGSKNCIAGTCNIHTGRRELAAITERPGGAWFSKSRFTVQSLVASCSYPPRHTKGTQTCCLPDRMETSMLERARALATPHKYPLDLMEPATSGGGIGASGSCGKGRQVKRIAALFGGATGVADLSETGRGGRRQHAGHEDHVLRQPAREPLPHPTQPERSLCERRPRRRLHPGVGNRAIPGP